MKERDWDCSALSSGGPMGLIAELPGVPAQANGRRPARCSYRFRACKTSASNATFSLLGAVGTS